ncbi:MAG: DNA internalization-related competence protein ComEC/Rec2 [Rhodoferax sp.]|nr:DNA internalization-related competence protein ComEC/Rec2 [Rhodoferax sp.]
MQARHHGTVVLLAWVLGTAVQTLQPSLWGVKTYMLFMALELIPIALVAIKNVTFKLPAAAWLLVTGMLAFGLTGVRAGVFAQHALTPALEGRNLLVTGIVAAMPQRLEAGLRFRLAVQTAALDGQPVAVPDQLELAWYSGVLPKGDSSGDVRGELQRLPADLHAGERWQMTVRLKAPHGVLNPHGFDVELFQWENGVQATGYVRAGSQDPPPVRLGATWQHPVEWARGLVRERIMAHVPDNPQVAGLLAALVVGDQQAIERADWDVFRATGVAHLMSISGLHVTMFAWATALLVGWLWRRSGWLCTRVSAPSAALLGGTGLALAYALFSGWGVPAQRTVLMLACVGVLRLLGARWPWPQVWLLACAVVVLADPWALWQAGFWLSFVAVGVLFATNYEAISAYTVSARGRFVALMREQWVITLALTPLSLLLFGQVSLVGLLANALAIPWVTLGVTPLALLGTLWPFCWTLAGWAIDLLMVFLSWLASWPGATLATAQTPLWAGAAGLLGGVLLAWRLPLAWRLLGVPLLLPVLLWRAPVPPQGQFELLAADIGQGNALLVRTAHHALLYDAGPRFSRDSDAGHRVLVPLLRALGVRLDMLVLSHRDTDHTGGASAVLAMQPQATVLSSIAPDHVLQSMAQVQRCQAGQRWVWDGVVFEVLHPQAPDYTGRAKPNAMSCTLRIANGTQSALLAGDIEQAQETRLVAKSQVLVAATAQADAHQATTTSLSAGVMSGHLLHADVLLVPHHGSKTSSSAAFLDAVQPRLALVQAGYRNRFGHPASPVLVRYQERHIGVVDSPRCGAATWQSWRPESVQCERQVRQRYWHHQVP